MYSAGFEKNQENNKLKILGVLTNRNIRGSRQMPLFFSLNSTTADISDNIAHGAELVYRRDGVKKCQQSLGF